MKCPKCNLTQIDANDLCVKCTFDLRPNKVSLGLPVTYPDKKYAELFRLIFKDQIQKSLNAQQSPEPKKETVQQKVTAAVAAETAAPALAARLPVIEPLSPLKLVAASKLFEEAGISLAASVNSGFSIDLFDIIGDAHREKINILFDTAEEEILNPEKSQRLKDGLVKQKVKIENSELLSQLKKVVEVFDNPALLLKNLKAKDLSHSRKKFVLKNAALPKRGLSFLADLVFCSIISFLIAVVLKISFDSEFSSRVFSFSASANDMRFFITGTAFCLPLAMIIYSFSTYVAIGTTIGETLIKSQPVKINGELPDGSDLLIKSFCQPFNLLFLGLIFTLIKKYSFCDYISDTFLHEMSKEELEVVDESSVNVGV